MKRYTVVTEKDESGHWIAHVRQIPKCHTYARSLWGVHKRIREALSLWIDVDIDEVEIDYDVALPADAQKAISKGQEAREMELRVNRETQQTLAESVKTLEGAGLSRRDIAELLGLSHQRIQQIAQSG